MIFRRQKELDSRVADRRLLLHYNKRLYIIQVGSDNGIKFLELIGERYSGEAYNVTKIKT